VRSDQNELANELRTVECDLLRDHSADREAEKVNPLQRQRINERRLRTSPCLQRFSAPRRGAGDARIIE